MQKIEIREYETVNHPPHYGGDTTYEVIKVLEAWLTPQEFVGFLKGNVIKYQARARYKGGLQDHEKATWYAQRLSEFVKQNPDAALRTGTVERRDARTPTDTAEGIQGGICGE